MHARAWPSLATLAAIAAGACAQPEVPADRFYRIELAQSETASATPRFTKPVEVERPEADGLLAGRAIVFSEGGTSAELLEYDYDFWAKPPSLMLRDQLVRCLENSGITRKVVTEQARIDAAYSLIGTLRRLERVVGDSPRSVVEIKLGVRDNGDGKLILWKSYKAEITPTDDSMNATVTAFSEAFTEVCHELSADIRAL